MRTKYGAKKETIDGIVFDSLAEGRRYRDLKLMERAGEIRGLVVHMPYLLEVNGIPVAQYEADFTYSRREGLEWGPNVVEDVKGMRTGPAWSLFRLKAKLFAAIYGFEIEVYPTKPKKHRRRK